MTSKLYTHFVTETSEPMAVAEYRGVVEIARPLRLHRELGDLRRLLARNFDLAAEDIKILHWATLH
jgi:hypothetical protein